MTAGTHIRIIRYPKLTGTVKVGSHQVTYRDFLGNDRDLTPPEPRVYIEWDSALGTPHHTEIREDLVEVSA